MRLRPVSDSFRSEAQSQIRSSMAQLNRSAAAQSSQALRSQVDLAKKSTAELTALAQKQARANVSAGVEQIRETNAIGAAYSRLARDATLSSEEQRVAARLAAESQATSMQSLSHNSDTAKEHIQGLKDSVKELAATFGTTIGIIAGLNLAKQIINSAAQGQKAAEAITSQFGKAGDAIKQFADGAAANLGISSGLAETTAAKFGIAYQQIGVGQGLAAQMTIGFEKLAGSISAIRGINPATVFDALSSAATGNTRSLRALGITIDQAQIKYAALKLGLISTIKDALTPAQKAEAVYALATARLGIYQDQAKKHAGDLANVQRRLSAEWTNAKDILGTALLPALTHIATRLADYLHHAEKTGALQRQVNRVLRDFHDAIKTVIAVVTPLVKGFQLVSQVAGGSKRVIEGLVAALLAIKARAVLVEFGLIDGGLKTMGADAKGAAAEVAGLKRGLLGLAGKVFTAAIVLSFVPPSGKGQKRLNERHAGFLGHLPFGVGNTFQQAARLDPFFNTNNPITEASHATNGNLFLPDTSADDFYNAARTGRKPPWRVPAHGLLAAAWLVGQAERVRELARRSAATNGGFNGIARAVGAAGKAVAAGTTGAAAAAAIKQDSQATIDAIQKAAQKQIDALRRQSGIGDAVANRIFNASVRAQIHSAQQRLAHAITEGKSLIGTAMTNLQNFIRTGTLSLEAGLRADHERLSSVGARAIKNLTTLGSTLVTDLNKFQDALSKRRPGTPGGQGPFGAADQQLLALIKGGRPSAALEQQLKLVQAQLAGKVPKGSQQSPAQKLAEAKRLVQQHIALLVEQAQKGQLTVKQLGDRLSGYMQRQGFTYRRLAHTIGKANADRIRADVDNLTKQLQQIGALPAGLRSRLLRASNNGLTSPVVNIVTFMARQAAADKARQDKYNTGLRAELAKLTKAQAHAVDLAKSAQKHLADVNAHEQLLTQQHNLAEAKKHTTLLTRIHKVLVASGKAQAKALAVQKGLAATQINAGFATSVSKANGKAAATSRTAAAVGASGGG